MTVDQLCLEQVGFNPLSGVSLVDWLATSSNELLMLTAGAVFHDGVGELTAAREALAWYPADVWTWMVGCQWRRISQEHAFVARTVEAGDELGTRILAGRLAGDAIRLAFLIERRYAPYSKWLAKGLDWLSWGNELRCYLIAALCADDGAIRQMQLANAYQLLGDKTNALRLCAPVDTSARPYYNRPSIVGPAAELSEALLAKVADPDLTRLRPHGAIDQLVDSSDSDWRVARPLYEALLAAP